jgi:hypothetical protein
VWDKDCRPGAMAEEKKREGGGPNGKKRPKRVLLFSNSFWIFETIYPNWKPIWNQMKLEILMILFKKLNTQQYKRKFCNDMNATNNYITPKLI